MPLPDNVLERIGAYVFPWGVEPPTVDDMVTTARHVEDLGYGSLQTAWHFSGLDAKYGNTFNLDPLVVTPILAAETRRIPISINSIILPILHPYFWARYFANLDIVAGGRIIPGVALGWSPFDFRIGLSNSKQRGRRFNEALDVYSRLTHGEPIEEPGEFWDATGLALDPAARGDLPLWIGAGEKSIDRAGRWATGLNPTRCSIEQVRNYRAGLDEAGERHGRRVDLIVTQTCAIALATDSEEWQQQHLWGPLDERPKDRDCDGSLVGSAETCADRLRAQFEAGADYVLLEFDFHGAAPGGEPAREQMTRFVEHVLPLV